ncbi:MAG TPA: Rieske (2Fe-2S) protein [Vicinamibacterales bacterium]|nr:Rieske (2Fe-2S) protein [Vicinamibacterales bacterium]
MSTANPPRRQFFARVIKTIQAAIGGTLGVVLGGSILSPSFARREENWLPATSLSGLPENAPTPIALRVVREDGYSQVVERRVVFLVKTGESVTALDPTCTHLGCRVSWDPDTRELRCPCHGGVYDHMGVVKSGPPPAPLPRLATRIDGDKIFIQV